MNKDKKQKSDWPVILFLFVGLPTAFIYGGIWVGLVVLVVGLVAFGWSKRHKGPFPTNNKGM